MKIKISPFAEMEIIESKDWYNIKKEGLGIEFIEALNLFFEKNKVNPLLYSPFNKYFRKAVMDKFPFNIIYLQTSEIVFIIAIFHQNRNPKNTISSFEKS